MSGFWSNYGDAVITFLITSILTFMVTRIKSWRENYKEFKAMKEQNKEFQKLFYKQALWVFYNEFEEGDKYIPPERYAFAKHQYDKYIELDGNGTTQFAFEKIERIYRAQQKLEEEKLIEAWKQKEGEHHE